MSETLLEAAKTSNEAVTQAPAAEATPVAESKPGEQQPSSEPAKPAEETPKPAEAAKADLAEPVKPAEGAPEKYDFKAPEGQSFDPQILSAFSEAARTVNLTQDAAQKILDTMTPALAARQAEQVAAIQKGWVDAVLADKEIGGELTDGKPSPQLKQKMAVAMKFVTTFDQKDAQGNGELAKLLEDTGLGNHPAVLRVLYRAGKAISEDTYVGRGNRESGTPVDPLKALYPTQFDNKE